MRSTAVVGLLLIVLGLAALAYQGINYTTRETVIDVGPLCDGRTTQDPAAFASAGCGGGGRGRGAADYRRAQARVAGPLVTTPEVIATAAAKKKSQLNYKVCCNSPRTE
jgi:hypothetical protein